MKICYISQYLPRVGGLENIVSDLAQRLAGEGHEIHVVTEHFGDTLEEEVIDGVNVHRFKASEQRTPLASNWVLAMYRMVKNVVKEYNIQLLHAHFAKNESVVAVRVGKKLKLPVITTGHGSDLMFEFDGFCSTKWNRIWVKYGLEHSTYITTVSNALKQNAVKLGIDEKKIRVIHNWLGPEKYKLPDGSTKKEIRKSLGWDTNIVLTSRRLVKKNGVDLLIRAMNELKPGADVRLVIIGDGPEKEDLIAQADAVKAHNIDFVDFTDFQTYIKMLNACDVYVVPSRWEGFGMVVLEAWAAGVPVVGTRVGGIPEIIENEINGVLVKPDPKNLADGIDSVLQDVQYQDKLTRNARKRLEEYFTWPRAQKEWNELYTKALSGQVTGSNKTL
jgi:N-acetyl-alpha-D-glucosaminyl L-malate synthase BshA